MSRYNKYKLMLSLMRKDQRLNSKETFCYFSRSSKLYREYQYNIVKICLQTNTLVCLPTGLGKTLIASVIMYNYYHWFHGKVFFFAPTKPLVNQQKSSFERLFPLFSEETIEMNGLISRKKREEKYRDNTFFFLTPQTFDNDLVHYLIDCDTISLMIFDEAHKAQKNYAYASIVKKVIEQRPNSLFRIIGLTASPGGNIESIQNVINGLMIKRIEFKSEKDEDMKQYIFNKKIIIEEIEMNADLNKIQSLLEGLIKQRLEVLLRFNIVDRVINPKYLMVTKLLKIQKAFKERRDDLEQEIGKLMINEIYQTFSLLFQVLHCKKKLMSEGIESFKAGINKIDIPNKQEGVSFSLLSTKKKCVTPGRTFKKKFTTPYSTARKNLIESNEFQEIKRELFRYENALTDSNNKQYHPKLVKLKEILLNQIDNIVDNGTKIIIFADYKDSTVEIKNFIVGIKEMNQLGIGVEVFTGQGKNFKQKDQLEIMQKFREGRVSILIATSVAEEGLDIGEVDLIICYDFNSTSPIKMIQRFGRTGRQRNGTVVVLATKGEEKTKYYRALRRIKTLYSNLKGLSENNQFNNKILLWGGCDNILVIPQSYFNIREDIIIEDNKEEDFEGDISDSEVDDDDEENGDEELNEEEGEQQLSKLKSVEYNTNQSHFPISYTHKAKTCKKVSFAQPTTMTKENNNGFHINNQYDITKYFNKVSSTPKISDSLPLSIDNQPKVLLSFKIKKQKTEDGKYKTSSSCQRPSLKSIPELTLNNNNKSQSTAMKIDSPFRIDQLELDKIIEEIETDEKLNHSKSFVLKENNSINNTLKSNKSISNNANNDNDIITDEALKDIFNKFYEEDNDEQTNNAMQQNKIYNDNKENIAASNDSISSSRLSFKKRKYDAFIKTKLD